MLFQIQISILFALNILKTKGWAMKEVIYECIRGLDWKISHCKHGMHGNCFNEVQKSMILDPCRRQNSGNNKLNILISWCHHNLRDLCIHTDVAWWKLKKYSHQKDIANYPDGCIICLKSFFVGCVSTVSKSTQIMKMKGNKREQEIKECMDCSIQVIFIWI